MKDCVFCQIIRGEKPAEIVHQGESVIAFKDIKPHAPIHILLVPKNHIRSINDLADEDRPVLSELVLKARQIAEELGIHRSGYKLVLTTWKEVAGSTFSTSIST